MSVDKQPRLAFKGEFHCRNDLSCTVRLGGKWVRYWLDHGEEPFDVAVVDDLGVVGGATVIGVDYMALSDVNECTIRFEHGEPTLWRDLCTMLQEKYGLEILGQSRVSVVWFFLKGGE